LRFPAYEYGWNGNELLIAESGRQRAHGP